MKSKRHHYIKAFSVAILILICTTVTESWAKEPYKIGGVFPMTGAAASIGKEHLVGVKIAVEQINAKGGIDGRKLEIVADDTKGKPAETVSLIEKLVQLHKVLAIIGPSLTHTSLAALPLASRYNIPLISLSGMVQVNRPFNPWAFRTGKSNEVVAAVISDYMKKQNINRVGLITLDTEGGKSFGKAFKSLAADRGIEIVKTTLIYPESRDVKPQLIRISKSKPDAILAWAFFNQLLNIAKTQKELELKQTLYLGNVVPMRNFIEVAKEVSENVIVTSEKVSIANLLFREDLQRPLINNYIEYSRKLDMKFPPELGGSAYDAVHLLAEAMRGSEGKKERIRDSLEQIKGFVGVGGVYSFSRKNHSGLGLESLSLVQIRDGKPYLVYSAKGCPQGTILCPDNICREICDE